MKKKIDTIQWTVWALTMVLSIFTILIGNRIVTEGFSVFGGAGDTLERATVTRLIDTEAGEMDLGGSAVYQNKTIDFECVLESGADEGRTVRAQQMIDSMYAGSQYVKEVEPGDSITIIKSEDITTEESGIDWQFNDYYRLDKIIILGCIFMVLILLLGRWKGVNTLLSLILTFSFVFFVFVPSVMNGYNAYIMAAITCVFTIIMTLLLINGARKKTWATVIGCSAGTMIAAFATVVMNHTLELTGFIDEHSYYLTTLNPDDPIDLTAIIFAAIIIGALGAIMDVAMDLSSALYELSEKLPDISFGGLYRSGMNIGRDIMGTMANTLVLAYIGSSLTSIMLLLTYSMSMGHLLNREVIIVEILQTLIGSLAILLTIPCTVFICGVLYLKRNRRAL